MKAIEMFGTPEIALHQTRITLTSIRPYTDRATSKVEDVLLIILRANTDERKQYLINRVRTLAAV